MMPLAVSQTPTIGAEIRGIDLRQDISQENVEWLEAQLVRHKVIFFRDQNIDPAAHLGFARKFGELETHPVNPKEGFSEIMVLHNNAENPHQEPLFGIQTLPGEQSLLWFHSHCPQGAERGWRHPIC